MLKIKNKTIHLNRGDSASIQIACNNSSFDIGQKLCLYIMEAGNCENILVQVETDILEESNTATLSITSEDTKSLSEPFSYGAKEFWYELELQNGAERTTLIGFDENGPKLFILYPEAIVEGGSI